MIGFFVDFFAGGFTTALVILLGALAYRTTYPHDPEPWEDK